MGWSVVIEGVGIGISLSFFWSLVCEFCVMSGVLSRLKLFRF